MLPLSVPTIHTCPPTHTHTHTHTHAHTHTHTHTHTDAHKIAWYGIGSFLFILNLMLLTFKTNAELANLLTIEQNDESKVQTQNERKVYEGIFRIAMKRRVMTDEIDSLFLCPSL